MLGWPTSPVFKCKADFLDCLSIKMKAVYSFEMSGAAVPTVQCHILEDMHLLILYFLHTHSMKLSWWTVKAHITKIILQNLMFWHKCWWRCPSSVIWGYVGWHLYTSLPYTNPTRWTFLFNIIFFSIDQCFSNWVLRNHRIPQNTIRGSKRSNGINI
jgi:hypothetical protein